MLLKSKLFWGYCFSAAFSAATFFSYLGGAPLIARQVFDLNTAVLGLVFGAPAIGYLIGNYLSGRFSEKFGINRMMVSGGVIGIGGMGSALLLSLLFKDSTVYTFFGFMITLGLANGLVIPNAMAGLLSSVSSLLAGAAASLSGAVLIAIGAIASLIAGGVVSAFTGVIELLLLFAGFSLCALISIFQTLGFCNNDFTPASSSPPAR